jgi:chromosomal replication initiator protein
VQPYTDPLWEKALEYISRQVNEGTFRIWFGQTAGLGLLDGTYSIGVPSQFAKDWIESRFRTLIVEALSQAADEPLQCEIVVVPDLSGVLGLRETAEPASWEPAVTPQSSASVQSPLATRPSRPGGHAPAHFSPAAPTDAVAGTVPGRRRAAASAYDTAASASGLLPKYTFDDFVVGPSNRFAHAAALAAAETPGTQYNPLFIYGGVGLGKTHLLQAVGHYVLRNHPGLKVRYVTLETFTNDFINSLRDDTIEGFKNYYRSFDVLLLDDIQFLHKKEQTQEEFFHTFNTLYDAEKQIVITSDRHPKGLATLEDRLVNRFEWGLITDIQPPDLETRVAILRKKVLADHISLEDDEVLMFIASRVPNNIRELEGCLTRVLAYSSLNHLPITLDLAREVLKDMPETATAHITIEHIISTVAEFTGVSVAEIVGDKRSRAVVESRHLAMYLARELTDASLPKIGECMGNRDHTTVLHAVEKITKLVKEDRQMYDRLQRLTAKLKSP